MKLAFKFTSTYILFLFLSLSLTNCNSAPEKQKTQEKHTTHYECPPCGCDSDGKISKTDGECPSCGIGLVKKEITDISNKEMFTPLKAKEKPLNVAIFLFHMNQVLDYAGPYDVFVAGGSSFNVYTVGATSEPIITSPNLSINPQFTINNAPKPDIIIIPAGQNDRVNQAARDWILKSAENHIKPPNMAPCRPVQAPHAC